jgi:phenylacetate-coenzyme A ligase PaaK-like adenylate-forming protein
LLEAALDWAVAEMDLRPPATSMPPPLALLRERVVSAIENVKFYAELYRPFGEPPLDLDEFIEWYSGLPAVSRTDFEDVPIEDRVSAAYASAPLVRKQTSGSTGIPLVIFIDEKVASFRSWRFRRPHFEAGENSPTSLEFLFPERFRRDKQVRVVGTSGTKDVTMRTERSYSTLTDALKSPELIYNDLAAKNPATLIGYASSIVRLAEWMGSERPLPSVKRIWTTSEMLTPDGRDAIGRAFGFDPREAYASVEFGFMGWQTAADGPFTLETDRLIFQGQNVTTGEASKPGELARVIVSDLFNDTTPLLRYDIGDLAILSEPAPYSATCYRSIEELRGKVTDSVSDAAGQRIEPFAILGCLKETLGAAQYRLVCLEPGLFVLQYRPARSAPIQLDAALKGLRDIVGDPIKVIAQQVPAIHRETSGKLRPIINLSTIEGKGRDQLLRDLNLADLQTAEIDLAS